MQQTLILLRPKIDEDLVRLANKCLDKVKCWCNNYNLQINLNRSKYMIFNINKKINNYCSDQSLCTHTYNFKYLMWIALNIFVLFLIIDLNLKNIFNM